MTPFLRIFRYNQNRDEYKVYSIIYFRALASLMKDAKVLTTSIVLDNNNSN